MIDTDVKSCKVTMHHTFLQSTAVNYSPVIVLSMHDLLSKRVIFLKTAFVGDNFTRSYVCVKLRYFLHFCGKVSSFLTSNVKCRYRVNGLLRPLWAHSLRPLNTHALI